MANDLDSPRFKGPEEESRTRSILMKNSDRSEFRISHACDGGHVALCLGQCSELIWFLRFHSSFSAAKGQISNFF